MRRESLSLILLSLMAVSVIAPGCSTRDTVDIEQLDDRIGFDINDPKIRERLGEDDGFALAVLYGADINGSLETCG